jgi:hypothetical protein
LGGPPLCLSVHGTQTGVPGLFIRTKLDVRPVGELFRQALRHRVGNGHPRGREHRKIRSTGAKDLLLETGEARLDLDPFLLPEVVHRQPGRHDQELAVLEERLVHGSVVDDVLDPAPLVGLHVVLHDLLVVLHIRLGRRAVAKATNVLASAFRERELHLAEGGCIAKVMDFEIAFLFPTLEVGEPVKVERIEGSLVLRLRAHASSEPLSRRPTGSKPAQRRQPLPGERFVAKSSPLGTEGRIPAGLTGQEEARSVPGRGSFPRSAQRNDQPI